MDDLIKRLESAANPQSGGGSWDQQKALLTDAAAALSEAQAEIARLEAERSELAFMGRTLQGWTQHDVLVNHEGAFQAISIMAERLAALSPREGDG